MARGDDRRPVAISAAQGRRIAGAVRAIENGGGRGGGKARAGGAVNWNPGVVRAKVTATIPTGTFAGPSNAGRAQIHHKDRAGAWKPSGDPVKVHNDHVLSAEIGVGDTIKLAWIGGDWFLIAADC